MSYKEPAQVLLYEYINHLQFLQTYLDFDHWLCRLEKHTHKGDVRINLKEKSSGNKRNSVWLGQVDLVILRLFPVF